MSTKPITLQKLTPLQATQHLEHYTREGHEPPLSLILSMLVHTGGSNVDAEGKPRWSQDRHMRKWHEFLSAARVHRVEMPSSSWLMNSNTSLFLSCSTLTCTRSASTASRYCAGSVPVFCWASMSLPKAACKTVVEKGFWSISGAMPYRLAASRPEGQGRLRFMTRKSVAL